MLCYDAVDRMHCTIGVCMSVSVCVRVCSSVSRRTPVTVPLPVLVVWCAFNSSVSLSSVRPGRGQWLLGVKMNTWLPQPVRWGSSYRLKHHSRFIISVGFLD